MHKEKEKFLERLLDIWEQNPDSFFLEIIDKALIINDDEVYPLNDQEFMQRLEKYFNEEV